MQSRIYYYAQLLRKIYKTGLIKIIINLPYYYNYFFNLRPLTYQQWILKKETPKKNTLNLWRNQAFDYAPTIEIICLFEGDIASLKKTIDSLQQQLYGNWHCLIVIKKNQTTLLNSHAFFDTRVDWLETPINFKNNILFSTLPFLQGDYGLWLEEGDLIPSTGLHYWIEAINKNPSGAIWYCDSDSINPAGYRSKPNFRPDWNRELYLSQNYIGAGCLLQLECIRNLPIDELIPDIELYDLILRFIEFGLEASIKHIPRILYHQKQCPVNEIALAERIEKETNALRQHFHRLKEEVIIKTADVGQYHHIVYPLPELLPTVTLIIPTRDNATILKTCINSILEKTTYPAFDIMVVNNDSCEENTLSYLDTLQNHPKITILNYNFPFNYSAINNFAVNQTKAEIIGLINDDIEVISPEWLTELIRHSSRKKIACVGAKLLYDDDTIQHAGVLCGVGDVAAHAHRYVNRNALGYFGRLQSTQFYSAVTGACMVVRKEIYQKVEGLNEKSLSVAYNDVDFCLKARKAGFQNIYTPYAELYHHESLSRGQDDTPEKKARYEKEVAYMWAHWNEELRHDPFYNTNLTRLKEDFSL